MGLYLIHTRIYIYIYTYELAKNAVCFQESKLGNGNVLKWLVQGEYNMFSGKNNLLFRPP